MIFEFSLDPIEAVHPWGTGEEKRLHWFNLTQGIYRLKVGDDYLLNYSNEFKEYLAEKYPQDNIPNTTFVDYYIVRLWEDILEMLPAILEPVTPQIQSFLTSGYKKYNSLNKRAFDWQESELARGVSEEETWEIVESATNWLNHRWFDSNYLSPSSRIWIWSDENEVVFSWDNRQIKVENIPAWSATKGIYRINKNEFIKEVERFNNKLFDEMNDRVEAIVNDWENSRVKIDLEDLKGQQKNRATWYVPKLKDSPKTDWNRVIAAIRQISV